MKILVLALSGIGDALMFTPSLKLIKKHYPGYQIDALVMYKGVREIYNRLDEVSNVYFHDFMKQSPFQVLKAVLSYRGKYEASISVYPSNRREYNIINFLTGAKLRGGIKYKLQPVQNLSLLNNILIDENLHEHNVIQNAKLVSKMFDINDDKIEGLNFPLTGEEISFADKFIEEKNLTEKVLVGIHAGCSTLKNHINRRWPAEKFAELVKSYRGNDNLSFLLFGGPEEKELKDEIIEKSGSGNIIFVETPGVPHAAALMRKCKAFVTNDSGLMHIAASQKVPVVAVIGPTNKDFIYPWGTGFEIASLNLNCSPCFFYSPKPLKCKIENQYKCVRELDYKIVKEKLDKLLNI